MRITILGQASAVVQKAVKPLLGELKDGLDALLFCDYAECDIPLEHMFIAIKDVEDSVLFEGEMKLISVIQSFLLPFDCVPSGHKTICKFTFPSGIPGCIAHLPEIDGWFYTAMPLHAV